MAPEYLDLQLLRFGVVDEEGEGLLPHRLVGLVSGLEEEDDTEEFDAKLVLILLLCKTPRQEVCRFSGDFPSHLALERLVSHCELDERTGITGDFFPRLQKKKKGFRNKEEPGKQGVNNQVTLFSLFLKKYSLI